MMTLGNRSKLVLVNEFYCKIKDKELANEFLRELKSWDSTPDIRSLSYHIDVLEMLLDQAREKVQTEQLGCDSLFIKS